MYQNNRILAIIPARGGSKGIPRKNIHLLDGKPLIAHTIEQALDSKFIDRVIVSTDDEEISRISQKFGAEVPFLRPKELAGDDTSTEDVLVHVVRRLEETEKYIPDIVVLLQCTSPIREKDDIDNAIKKMVEGGADSLLSVCGDNSFLWKEENNFFTPVNYDYTKRPRRQEMRQFMENGSIYVSRRKVLMNYKNRLGGRIQTYVMGVENSFEIDTEFEFWLVEQILKRRKNE